MVLAAIVEVDVDGGLSLSEYDDCFDAVGSATMTSPLYAKGGNDLLCGSDGEDEDFFGALKRKWLREVEQGMPLHILSKQMWRVKLCLSSREVRSGRASLVTLAHGVSPLWC